MSTVQTQQPEQEAHQNLPPENTEKRVCTTKEYLREEKTDRGGERVEVMWRVGERKVESTRGGEGGEWEG